MCCEFRVSVDFSCWLKDVGSTDPVDDTVLFARDESPGPGGVVEPDLRLDFYRWDWFVVECQSDTGQVLTRARWIEETQRASRSIDSVFIA